VCILSWECQNEWEEKVVKCTDLEQNFNVFYIAKSVDWEKIHVSL
jgi:hypothetical protein